MDKTNYVLNKPELAANETVWAFDLGKGSIGSPGGVAPVDEFPGVAGVTPRGEAVRRGNEFLHKASLLIPAEWALPRGRECCACLRRPRSRVLPWGETKTAAGRRRMWRTRQAHRALIGAIKKMNRCSHRPSPAGGGIVVVASGKDFQAPCRSDMVAVRKDYAAPTALC